MDLFLSLSQGLDWIFTSARRNENRDRSGMNIELSGHISKGVSNRERAISNKDLLRQEQDKETAREPQTQGQLLSRIGFFRRPSHMNPRCMVAFARESHASVSGATAPCNPKKALQDLQNPGSKNFGDSSAGAAHTMWSTSPPL